MSEEPKPTGKGLDGVPQVGRVFEIQIPEGPDPWHAVSACVGATLFPGDKPEPGSKALEDGRPWRMWKSNYIRRAGTTKGYRECWLVIELNGVFVHIADGAAQVRVIVADKRLDP
jgi:hypothetical protein